MDAHGLVLSPFATVHEIGVQVRVPPNKGLQVDAPQAARA